MALEFSLDSEALPRSAKVVGFKGTEALTRPYQVDIYVAVPAPAEIPEASVVGRPATLAIHPQSGDLLGTISALPVTYGGILARCQMIRATAAGTLYRATLVPRLWNLGQTRRNRVWTKMSIADIIKAVLSEEGVARFEFRASGGAAPQELVCQYRESSLDFIHRWMEREGLYYYFEQEGGAEKLVIVDSMTTHPPNAHGPVRYRPGGGEGAAGRHFDSFVASASSLPATVRASDYDYSNPSVPVIGASPGGGLVGEVAEWASDARVFDAGAASQYARVRAEALRSSGKEGRATGSALGLAPGHTFALEEHPHASLDKLYLVTRQTIIGRAPSAIRGWRLQELDGAEEVLSIEIGTLPAEVQYREPRRTAWPRVDGYESAVVDGPADSQYAQIDPTGRYAVKLKFDEGPLTAGQASCFVRMMQPHAGAPEGKHLPLRKGTEVILIFLGGDPDRPVIAGAIPDATHPSVVTASNNTKNVLQTGSRNRFELEDKAGSEWMKLSTEGDQTHLFMGKPGEGGDHSFVLETEKDGLAHTGTNLDLKVDQKWDVKVKDTLTEEVQSDVTEKYHATLSQTVDSSKTVKISGSFEETIGGGSTQDISGGLTQTISGGETRSVSGGLTESISGSETRDVSGSVAETINGSWTQTISASATQTTNASATHTISGSLTQTVVGGATLTTPAAYSLTATGGVDVNCAAGMKVTAPGGVQFVAPGGFTVIAPGGVRTVDQQLLSNGGSMFRFFLAAETFVGLKLDAYIGAFSFGGIKVDAAPLSVKFGSWSDTNLAIECNTMGAKVACVGLAKWFGGAKVVV